MTETIEQQNVLQTDRMKNGITTELQNDRMTEKQNDKTRELQNDRMTQRQNQGRRWTYRTYLSRSLRERLRAVPGPHDISCDSEGWSGHEK